MISLSYRAFARISLEATHEGSLVKMESDNSDNPPQSNFLTFGLAFATPGFEVDRRAFDPGLS